MKITNKQRQEIEFLSKEFNITPTKKDIEDYILCTVKGKIDIGGKFSSNPLMIVKTGLDRTIKMWREDLVSGILSIDELYEEFGQTPYGNKLITSVLLSVNFKKNEYRDGITILSMVNALKQDELIKNKAEL